jgi:hypothetical protein
MLGLYAYERLWVTSCPPSLPQRKLPLYLRQDRLNIRRGIGRSPFREIFSLFEKAHDGIAIARIFGKGSDTREISS